MRRVTSSAVTGRRNARCARLSVIWRAQEDSSFELGLQTKMRSRLGVLETPVGSKGPLITTPSTSLFLRPGGAHEQLLVSSSKKGSAILWGDSTWERSMKATTTSWTPASA